MFWHEYKIDAIYIQIQLIVAEVHIVLRPQLPSPR